MTTQLWWPLLVAAVAISALEAAAEIGASTSTMGGGPPGAPPPPNPLLDPAHQRSLATAGAIAGIFALVVGIVMVTSEFRHLTSRPTFLIEPRRRRVIGAKLVVAALVGALYAIASAMAVAAVMALWLGAEGISIGWIGQGVVGSLARSMLAVVIYAVVGVGVGTLVRNQLAAVIGGLGFFLVAETLIAAIPGVQRVYPLLPGPASDALVGSPLPSVGGPSLTPWEGGLLFAAWALGLALCAGVTTLRRDIP
ncbi:MAG: hypothetical protein ACLQT7_04180 [Candidatus Dormibacteria bacterium]